MNRRIKKEVLDGLYAWYFNCREIIGDENIHEKGLIGEIYTEARDRIKTEI